MVFARKVKRLLHHNHLGRKKSDESRGTRKLFIISKCAIVNLSSPCLVSCANNNAFAAVLYCKTSHSSSSNRRIKYSSCKTYGHQETPRHPPRSHLHLANFSAPEECVCPLNVQYVRKPAMLRRRNAVIRCRGFCRDHHTKRWYNTTLLCTVSLA